MKTSTKLILVHVVLSVVLVIICAIMLPTWLHAAGVAAAEIQKGYEAARADGGRD